MTKRIDAPFLFGLLLTVFSVSLVRGQETAETIKIGTYDSRAIAVAFAPSRFNPVKENMQEYNKAKAEKNTSRMKELEAWGKKHQRELHRQGFSTVPVNNLIAHVKDQLPALAKSVGVIAIVRECDFTAPNVEVVDVTDELVKLYDPTPKTLRTVGEIRKVAPADLDEVEKHHDH